jgi:hypothetical protein
MNKQTCLSLVLCAPLMLCTGLAPAQTYLSDIATHQGQEWRYTTDKPAAEWFQGGFDDSAWKVGKSGFGSAGTPNAKIGTAWTTSDIYLRRTFEYAAQDFKVAAVHVYHDEDVTVYLNGQKLFFAEWFEPDYKVFDVTAEFHKLVKRGANVLAVHCHQTVGGQYVDVGLVLDPPHLDKPGAASRPAAANFGPVPPLPAIKPLFDFPLRDPSVVLVNGVYYLTGTTGHPTWWKTNEGIRMWKSTDLARWEPMGLVWEVQKHGTWAKKVVGDNRAVWAPEVHFIRGTFWLTYSMNYGGCGLLKSTSGKPDGPYEDVKKDGPLTPNIDASLFVDDDGKVYFVWQNGMIARLNDEMTDLAEKPRHLKPANAKEVGFEGAFLFKAGKKYILACASFERAGRYDCMAAASDSLMGPYGDRYLAVPHGGHNMFFRDKEGQWWSTLFGSDQWAPVKERAAILRVTIDAAGKIAPVAPAAPKETAS